MRWHALVVLFASGSAAADPSVKQLVAQLADAKQDVRDAAAAKLRGMKIAPVDWKAKLAKIPKGVSEAEFAKLTGATMQGGGGGYMTSMAWQLDDTSAVDTTFDPSGRLAEIGEVTLHARSVWVEPPKGFTGTW